MASQPFEPFINVDGIQQRVQKELNRMFDGDWISDVVDTVNSAESDWRPRADVSETDDHFIYFIDVPGVNLDDIDVTIKRNVLSVSGTRLATANAQYHERKTGNFARHFDLPPNADEATVTASGKNGVLEIRLAKVANETARRVPINEE